MIQPRISQNVNDNTTLFTSSVSYLTELACCFLENEAPAFVEVAEFEDWPVINKFIHVKVYI